MTNRARNASTVERERLVDEFVSLCEIDSRSGRERAVADAVTATLRAIGLEVEEDDSGAVTGSDCGNLLARIEGPPGSRTILLCAHLDTVPAVHPVEVARSDGMLTNRNEAILGADNKAAVAGILAAARRLTSDGAPVGVELLFTTCEERSLLGAKAFDTAKLRSEFGYVFDHPAPVGELVLASPTYYLIEAEFHGRAAHAGLRVEDGRNAIVAAAGAIAAIPNGRLDELTTANVGRIGGGTAVNVVPERCSLAMEVRSLDPPRADRVAGSITDILVRSARDAGCAVEPVAQRLSDGYEHAPTDPVVEVAAAALRSVEIDPVYVRSGGGSDANALVASGLRVLNVGNGTEKPHEPDERVSVEALEATLDVILAIVAASAR